MLSYEMHQAVAREQHKDMLRRSEQQRLINKAGQRSESWFSRMAKRFERPSRQERMTFNRRPAPSPR